MPEFDVKREDYDICYTRHVTATDMLDAVRVAGFGPGITVQVRRTGRPKLGDTYQVSERWTEVTL